jgi:hypothetical protein
MLNIIHVAEVCAPKNFKYSGIQRSVAYWRLNYVSKEHAASILGTEEKATHVSNMEVICFSETSD